MLFTSNHNVMMSHDSMLKQYTNAIKILVVMDNNANYSTYVYRYKSHTQICTCMAIIEILN